MTTNGHCSQSVNHNKHERAARQTRGPGTCLLEARELRGRPIACCAAISIPIPCVCMRQCASCVAAADVAAGARGGASAAIADARDGVGQLGGRQRVAVRGRGLRRARLRRAQLAGLRTASGPLHSSNADPSVPGNGAGSGTELISSVPNLRQKAQNQWERRVGTRKNAQCKCSLGTWGYPTSTAWACNAS